MKVFLGSDPRDLAHAREWFSHPTYFPVHRELEMWAIGKAVDWGEPALFVEVVVPGIGGHSQCDLLVAFQDRLALCEVKMKPLQVLEEDIVEDAGVHTERLEGFQRVLRGKRFSPESILACFYLPQLSSDDADRVRDILKTQRNAIHLWVACADAHRRNLSRHLEAGLNRRSARPAPTNGFPAMIRGLIKQPIVVCEGVDNARRYLQAQRPAPPIATHPFPEYDPMLRAEEWRRAKDILDRHGVVEIAGAPGMGRKTLAKDLTGQLITSLGYGRVRKSIVNATSLERIAETLWIDLHGVPPTTTWDETLAALCQSRTVFLLDDYDGASQTALLEWLNFAKAAKSGAGGRPEAYWIVVSVSPMLVHDGCSVTLAPVADEKLYPLLDRSGAPGRPDHEKDHVLVAARGNPRLAMWMWRSSSKISPSLRFSDSLEWVLNQLTEEQRRALPGFCKLLGNAPLGVTLESLSTLADVGLERSQAAALRNNAQSLAEMLASFQFLVRTPVQWELLATIGAPSGLTWRKPCFLRDMNRDLDRFVRRHEAPVMWIADRESRDDFTLRDAADSLASVTTSLLSGDLTAFFRSSFRLNAHDVSAVCEWVHARAEVAGPLRATQAYLLRALWRTNPAVPFSVDDLMSDPGPPQPDSAPELFAFEVLTAYARARALKDAKDIGGIDAWLSEAGLKPDPILATELQVRAAGVFQDLAMPDRQWQVLSNLLARRGSLPSPSRGLILFRALAFLNATHSARIAIPADDARQSILDELWPELLELGLAQENVDSVCNAIFYAARAEVLEQRQDMTSDLRRFQPLLQFVERASKPRRLQAIQTRASVYRYIGQREATSWEEFEEDFVAATAMLERAGVRAAAETATVHWLNTLAYGMQLCRNALRFHDKASLRQPLVRACLALTNAASQARARLSRENAHRWKNILRSVVLYHPLVAGIAQVGLEGMAPLIPATPDDLVTEAVEELEILVREGNRTLLQKELPQLMRALLNTKLLYTRWRGESPGDLNWWKRLGEGVVSAADRSRIRDRRVERRSTELRDALTSE